MQDAADAYPEGHDQSGQQPHGGSLGQGTKKATDPCLDSGCPTPPHEPAWGWGTLTGLGTLTVGLAQGKNMPRQKSPRSGPPTMPKMLMAA